MKLSSSFILLVAFAVVSSQQSSNTSSVKPTETTTVIDTTTTSTTRQPDTTTVSPSTTTILPTSSSTEPTTTVKSSTASPDTTTSSPKSTSTPQPDTTTPPPTLPPVPSTKSPEPPTPADGSWNVTEGNLTCIRADLKVRFKISVKDRVEYIVLNPNATSNGNCKLSDTTQEMQLEESEYIFTMLFEKDSNNAYMKNVTFTYTLPDNAGTVFNDSKLFSVKVGNSYMCDSSNDVILGDNVTMEVFRIHIQSFGSVGNKDFGTAEECDADNKVNDMVPIAVGIALLVLVVVVLIAYFVGRRRSRQKGYQSV